jgi:Ca2+-binding EF-hand superfamily protein
LVQLYDLSVNDLEHLKAQFRAVDSDNNGVLTERELKLFLKRLRVRLTDA